MLDAANQKRRVTHAAWSNSASDRQVGGLGFIEQAESDQAVAHLEPDVKHLPIATDGARLTLHHRHVTP